MFQLHSTTRMVSSMSFRTPPPSRTLTPALRPNTPTTTLHTTSSSPPESDPIHITPTSTSIVLDEGGVDERKEEEDREMLIMIQYGTLRLFRVHSSGVPTATLFITPSDPKFIAALLPMLGQGTCTYVVLQPSERWGYYYLICDGLRTTDTPVSWHIIPGDHRAVLILPLVTGCTLHLPHPSQSYVELPVCPRCTERIDASATGMSLSICGGEGGGGGEDCGCDSLNPCFVCRTVASSTIACGDCSAQENVWVCLVCGYPGCGRYSHRHAEEHFSRTGHDFTMNPETQQVWGYLEDRYVHRFLRQGAAIQLPDGHIAVSPISGPTAPTFAPNNQNQQHHTNNTTKSSPQHHPKEDTLAMLPPAVVTVATSYSSSSNKGKVEAVAIEFSHLLAQQLESQRMYFMEEERIEREAYTQAREEKKRRLRAIEGMVLQQQALLENNIEHSIRSPLNAYQSLLDRQQNAVTKYHAAQQQVLILTAEQDEIKTKVLEDMRVRQQTSPIVTTKSQILAELRQEVSDLEQHLRMAKAAGKKLGKGAQGDVEGNVIVMTSSGIAKGKKK
eukprot:PhF_6_TR24811/c0_g1_i2/m.34151/K10632/BRAP; BRCA1-associated protein